MFTLFSMLKKNLKCAGKKREKLHLGLKNACTEALAERLI